ncbi:MAG: MFS transporter [Chloroflexota bacterium]
MSKDGQSAYRWYILGLAAATHTFAAAMPLSCMPVLFGEMSEDLGLSLVQIGAVWGVVSLAGVFVALLAGMLGDRFGTKLVLGSACLLGGLAGSMRGLSGDFASLAATVFIFGLIRSTMPINVHKTVSVWFRGRNLGMANGVVSMGMGIGLMMGPLISATILSPLLGGWRNVLLLYGAVSIAIGLLWLISGREYRHLDPASGPSGAVPIRQALSELVRIKDLWLLGFTLMFRSGCIHGLTGYVPLYLRQQGWALASADGALAAFYVVSTTAVIPLSLLSDRLVSRKAILIPALLTTVVGLSLLPLADGILVWGLLILVGIFMDSFMAIIISMVQETVGVGPRYSGTALGLVFTMAMSGAFLSPPLGNSLASVGPGLPFVFWAALSAVAVVILFFARETAQRR